jgi:hypothetical protein
VIDATNVLSGKTGCATRGLPARRSGGVMRVLVVEDEPDLAFAIAISLRRDGYAVDVAGDGASALDRVGLNEYDLVCLDLNLPDVDGLDVCRQVMSKRRRGALAPLAARAWPGRRGSPRTARAPRTPSSGTLRVQVPSLDNRL